MTYSNSIGYFAIGISPIGVPGEIMTGPDYPFPPEPGEIMTGPDYPFPPEPGEIMTGPDYPFPPEPGEIMTGPDYPFPPEPGEIMTGPDYPFPPEPGEIMTGPDYPFPPEPGEIMTGPGYPFPPEPGSNGMGLFPMGIGQIGDIPIFDPWETVISQYANSPRMTQMILDFNGYMDQTENFSDFYDFVMNLDTAQGYGLDIWGRIVGVNRVLQIVTTNWFGFAEASPGSSSFGQDAFYSGAPLTSNYALSDQSYRQLIFAKAAANITNGSIPAINRILMNLFPDRGNVFVTEGGGLSDWFGFEEAVNSQGFNQAAFYSGSGVPTMTMTYTFMFPLTPVELAIVQNSGVLPKPTGVAASVVIIP